MTIIFKIPGTKSTDALFMKGGNLDNPSIHPNTMTYVCHSITDTPKGMAPASLIGGRSEEGIWPEGACDSCTHPRIVLVYVHNKNEYRTHRIARGGASLQGTTKKKESLPHVPSQVELFALDSFGG